jgi:hypothetical protein
MRKTLLFCSVANYLQYGVTKKPAFPLVSDDFALFSVGFL